MSTVAHVSGSFRTGGLREIRTPGPRIRSQQVCKNISVKTMGYGVFLAADLGRAIRRPVAGPGAEIPVLQSSEPGALS